MSELAVSHVFWVLLTAIGCGAVLGAEREWTRNAAGLRTNALVAFGAALFTLLSIHGFHGGQVSDPARVAAQVVTGIGFLGAGVIIQRQNRVHGLTTAATIWAAAALGLTAGTGAIQLAWFGAGLIVVMQLVLRRLEEQIGRWRGIGRVAMKPWTLLLEVPPGHADDLHRLLAIIENAEDVQLLDAHTEPDAVPARVRLLVEGRRHRTIRSLQASMLLAGFKTIESRVADAAERGR